MENANPFASTRPSGRLMRGIATASRAHDGHYRKGSGVPYISHPMAVMLIAASVTNDEDVLLAALFHDILEDVPENYSRAEMKDEFGLRVVEIVEGVTKILPCPPGRSVPMPTWSNFLVAARSQSSWPPRISSTISAKLWRIWTAMATPCGNAFVQLRASNCGGTRVSAT